MKKRNFVCVLFLSLASIVFCQPKAVKNLGGHRLPAAESNQKVKIISAVSSKVENSFQIDINFSGAVDPKSVKAKNIFVNSKSLPETTKLTFSRDMTRLRFFVSNVSSGKLSVRIAEVRSLSGKFLGELKF